MVNYDKDYGNIVLLFLGEYMEREFNLYWIDMKYIRNLQNKDKRVYSVSPQRGKQNRPYLGILVLIHNQKYCIPLSKEKEKYAHMKDRIDFTRIIVDGKIIAGLNFSRMIPVEITQMSKVDLKIRKRDNIEVKQRKETYKKELEWCNNHKTVIIDKANVLYQKYISGEWFKRKKDCLNFPELEEVCAKYNKQNFYHLA